MQKWWVDCLARRNYRVQRNSLDWLEAYRPYWVQEQVLNYKKWVNLELIWEAVKTFPDVTSVKPCKWEDNRDPVQYNRNR